MKVIFTFIYFITLFSCKETHNKEESNLNSESNILNIEKNEQKESNQGVLNFSIYPNFTRNDSITFYKEDKSIYATIKKDTLYFQNQRLSIFDYDIPSEILNSFVFFPDYGAWYSFAERLDNQYKIKLKDNSYIYLPINNRHYFFEDYYTFLKEQQIGLTDKSPLYSEKSQNSKIIENYKNYIYEAVETYDGNWVKLKLTERTEPGDEPYNKEITGWVKWKNEQSLNIVFYYE
jgi:hypothetical protein